MSEKPWCHICGLRHDDPRLELDGPIWSTRTCAAEKRTVGEVLFILALVFALAAFVVLAVCVIPFAPVAS